MPQTTDAHWAKTAARAADEKSATDVVILEVGPVLAIAEEIEASIGENGGPKPLRVEGLSDRQWILLDYGDLVVHVFLEETRAYYDLERLWADVPRVAWQQASLDGPASQT